MGADYKPGTVADIDVPGRGWCRAFYVDGGLWLTAYAEADGIGDYETKNVTEVRPLVVLDPDDVEQVKTLRDWLGSLNYYGTIWQLQSSLRQMTKPPKPAEPTGLGAVVEDTEGRHYVRHCPGDCEDGGLCIPWHRVTDALNRTYDEFDVARVLSDGWEPKP